MNDLHIEMRDWRRDIHKHPELGFSVTRTADKVAALLQSFGIEVHTNIGKTGVVGVLKKGTSNKTIGLRADMDALPIQERGDHDYKSIHHGAFHGCGHDGHTAMLLGAAKLLSAQADMNKDFDVKDFDGTVYFIFQPSEEDGLGALAMINDGLFDRFPMDAIYGIHNMPGIAKGHFAVKPGQMMTSEDNFVITVTGKGGHASMPNKTLDPMIVGAEIVTALQSIVSRALGPDQWGVVSVTEFITDGARNIIPSTVTIKGDCRALDPDVQIKIELRMRQIVGGICSAHGVTGSVDYSHEFIVLVNSEHETNAAVNAARATVDNSKIDPQCQTCTCSEDFAQYLHHRPGCFILIGNGNAVDQPPLHNPYYDYEDDILTIGTDYWVNLVYQQLAVK
jgi:amidohydrolase